MKHIIAKLVNLANSLDEKGLMEEASMVDAIISEATGERKFDIFAKGRVGVKANVYQSLSDMDEPPPNSHVKAEVTLMVRPVENNQVMESKIVWNKQYVARNLQELKTKMAADVASLKQQYAPASYDEQFEFYPVK
jgi:hypothetical protein